MKKFILLCFLFFMTIFQTEAYALSEKWNGLYIAPKFSPTGGSTAYTEYYGNIKTSYEHESQAPSGMGYSLAIGKDYSSIGISNYRLEVEYLQSSLTTIDAEDVFFSTYTPATFTQSVYALFMNAYYEKAIGKKFGLYLSLSCGVAIQGLGIEYENRADNIKEEVIFKYLLGFGFGGSYKFNENWAVDLNARILPIFGGEAEEFNGYHI